MLLSASSGRSPRSRVRAALVWLAASLAGIGLPAPAAIASSSLIGLSLGGESALAVSVGGESGVGATVGGEHALGVTVGGEEGAGVAVGGEEGAAGVSVGGQPVASVPAPTTPALPPPPSPPEVAPVPVSTGSPPATKPPSTAGLGSTVASNAKNTPAGTGSTGRAQAAPRDPRPASGARRTQDSVRSPRSSAAGVASPTRTTGPLAVAAARHAVVARRSTNARDPLDAIGSDIPLPLPVPDWSKPIILALLIVCLALALRAALVSRRARRLEGQRRALMRDIDAMQAALVPAVAPNVGGLLVSVAYRPADGPAAGGDFYDVFTPADGTVALILGDVSGHGREALTRAALTRYTLRAYMQAGMQPRAALALAGRVLAEPDCELLATVVVGLYDVRAGTLTYALAGHPPPIVTGFRLPDPPMVCCSPPLGWDIPTGRRQCTISIPPDGAVCLFSDGLVEARCEEGEGGGLLGRDRLAELFASLGGERTAPDVLAAVRAAAVATPDDMAACVVRPDAERADPLRREGVHQEELEVDRQAIESGHVREFLLACSLEGARADRLLERAQTTAQAFQTALLTVDRSGSEPVAIVTAPPPAAHPSLEVADRPALTQALLGSSAP